ncbi:MAG: phosphate/phosphite/phosphonate ABC transporter substrate-binding protein [Anaerolineae bacterium]
MKKQIWLLVLTLLAACAPETIFVEVTREVPVSAATVLNAPETVEVTRQVSVDVTRVVTDELMVEVTRSPLGSPARPIQILFPPLASTAVIADKGQQLADVLSRATGSQFVVGVADSETAVIQLLCAAPGDTIGVLPAAGVVQAAERCEAVPGVTAVHADGYPWQTGMLVVDADSGLNTLADLAGKRWGIADENSLPDTIAFRAMLAQAGVAPGEIVAFPGESDAILALFNGDVDFVTAAFVAPILPYDERPWVYGEDDPELWRELGYSPSRSPIGYVIVWGETRFGGYQLRDARARIFDIEPRIYDETRILTLSPPIPNETFVYGADFPLALSLRTTAVLLGYAADADACAQTLCASDFTGWTGLTAADESLFEAVWSALQMNNEQ